MANSSFYIRSCGLRHRWARASLVLVFLCAGALVLPCSCSPRSVVRQVSGNDYALVEEGRYEGRLEVFHSQPRLDRLSVRWRNEIEAEPGFLHRIAEKYFSIPVETEFRFMYVGEDSAARALVLRYFGFAPKPFIIAGWQVQFVFDLPGRRLARVLTQEVPLE